MPRHPLHNVAIAGYYNTKQARFLHDHTSQSLTMDAIRGVLNDAGLTIRDIDGLTVSMSGVGGQNASQMVYFLGMKSAWTGHGDVGVAGVAEAANAIAMGQARTVVVAGAQAGVYSERLSTAPWTRPSNEFVECWGLFTAAEFALIARRHMHRYGTRPEHLATVAATIRNHGHLNPDAIYFGRGPFTPEEVLSSRMIADPFHLLDCAMTSEGGCAIVLTTAERARDLKKPPVYVLGGGVETFGPAYQHPPSFDLTGWVGREAARKTFAMAGMTPQDVDVCEFYDPFSFELIRQFEAYGFCGEGEGGDFIMGGTIGLDGRYPLCTDGGLMSFSHSAGGQAMQRVIEGVRQIRREGGPTQVKKEVNVALCSNYGAGALFTNVLLLGKEQP